MCCVPVHAHKIGKLGSLQTHKEIKEWSEQNSVHLTYAASNILAVQNYLQSYRAEPVGLL